MKGFSKGPQKAKRGLWAPWRRPDVHLKEVIRGSVIAFALRILGAGLAFLFNLLLAKACGAAGSGLYFISLAVVGIAALIGRLGLDNSLVRFIAANAALGKWSRVQGVYRLGVRWTATASFLMALGLWFAAPWLARSLFHKSELARPLGYMALGVVPLALFVIQAAALKGLRRIRDSATVESVSLPFFSILFLGIFLGLGQPAGAVLAYVAAAGMTVLLGFWLWWRATPRLRAIRGRFEAGELFNSSFPLLLSSSMNLLINWIATFTLGIWGTKQEAGLFGAASRTALLISLILLAVNSASAPKFAGLFKKGKMRELDRLARHSTRLMAGLSLPILILFLAFPGFVMGFFGPEFKAGGGVLAILALGQFVNVATGSVGILLVISGNERVARNRSAAVALFGLFLNLLLVPRWGMVGAAVSTALCVASSNLISAYFVWSKLGIWTLPFPRWVGKRP